MRLVLLKFVSLAMLLASVSGRTQQATADYRAILAAAGRDTIQTPSLTITGMDAGAAGLGTNRFAAHVSNRSNEIVALGLSLRSVPGLWVRSNWQRSYRFEIAPRSSRVIEGEYLFSRMTPEATLRVSFGAPRDDQGGIDVVDRFYDRTLAVGRGNPAATDPRLSFDTLSTEHFEIFAWRGSLAAKDMKTIAAQREVAVQRIAELLGVAFTDRIRLVLYPDSAIKTSQTGHVGAGWASGLTIVEIFNDSVQLDPYHEVAHIVAERRGSPPAMLDEGFAVYVAEILGADALRYLGSPGRTVAETVCTAREKARLIPLARLFHFTDIGPDSTLPGVSYPQAASVTRFLIEGFGIERFRELYARLSRTTQPAGRRGNEETLEQLYGLELPALERAWRESLRCG